MDRERLYDEYIKENSEEFLEFESIRLDNGKVTLIFYGKDIEGNDIKVEIGSEGNAFGNTIISCGEVITLAESQENYHVEVYVKNLQRRYVDLYDWL